MALIAHMSPSGNVSYTMVSSGDNHMDENKVEAAWKYVKEWGEGEDSCSSYICLLNLREKMEKLRNEIEANREQISAGYAGRNAVCERLEKLEALAHSHDECTEQSAVAADPFAQDKWVLYHGFPEQIKGAFKSPIDQEQYLTFYRCNKQPARDICTPLPGGPDKCELRKGDTVRAIRGGSVCHVIAISEPHVWVRYKDCSPVTAHRIEFILIERKEKPQDG